MAAGPYAFRGSGPGQKLAFEMAHLGCPDHRFDRFCITCCQPSPTVASHALAYDLVRSLLHGYRANREQAAQISVALLADIAELDLTVRRVLLR
ncbi:hypothetical protein [Filomicrobium insigne]|uniref:hypothetical protein n=1 Tax=Filomicrobium insigne TaxID=418854 RepID=UPI000B7E8A04